MGKKQQKNEEKRKMAKLDEENGAVVNEAKKIAVATDLDVDWESGGRCQTCKIGLAKVIVQYREKGKIFEALSKVGESEFHNCEGLLRQNDTVATKEGAVYAVEGCYVIRQINKTCEGYS